MFRHGAFPGRLPRDARRVRTVSCEYALRQGSLRAAARGFSCGAGGGKGATRMLRFGMENRRRRLPRRRFFRIFRTLKIA